MKLRFYPILFSLLATGIAPFCYFCDSSPMRISVRENSFDVRHQGATVEAIHIGHRTADEFVFVAADAKRAIEQVTKCKVMRLNGDAVVFVARVNCETKSA